MADFHEKLYEAAGCVFAASALRKWSKVNAKDGNACQMPGKKKCCIIGQNKKQSLSKLDMQIWVDSKKYSCAKMYPAAALVW